MKLNLKIIVALISVAIIGLIIVQIIWISNAIEVKKSNFDQEVRQSLVSVTQQVPVVIKANQEAKIYQRQKRLGNDANSLNSLFDAMFQNTAFGKLKDKISPDQMDSLIKKELIKKGINTPYLFSVYDITGKSLYEQDSMTKSYNNYLLSEGINIPVYMDEFMLSQSYITLFFPKKSRFIFKKMFLILSISFLLILTVIYAFYFTVNTIRKQKQLSEIKNDFINNMTHELKTPISTIQLACEALNDPDMNSAESQHSFVEMIKDENTRLRGLVETVLKTAILDKGQMKLQMEEVNLLDIIHRVKENFTLQISQLGGEMAVKNELPEMKYMGDSQHLTNVLQNLVDNALKYTKNTPKIEITTLKTVSNFILKVSDNGIGISKENTEKIFEKLYRVPTGDLHNVKGFGIGLNYVKSIVELHGGTVTVESNINVGSTFILTLPLTKKPEQ